ncbi:hypothetical protein Tco_0976270 [Tanacetum coccineum]|uniref:Uncharacterized protein n=1 Tax=Tanacetum coccineum TaxID=301880 RepID=A0ABQ5EGR2_9ASTR
MAPVIDKIQSCNYLHEYPDVESRDQGLCTLNPEFALENLAVQTAPSLKQLRKINLRCSLHALAYIFEYNQNIVDKDNYEFIQSLISSSRTPSYDNPTIRSIFE